MKGTQIEGNGIFYHDALSLMTYTRSIAYHEKHNLLKCWLLLVEDLQPEKRYRKSIPGDSPELNILDETCNADIHSSTRYHISITSRLQKDDPRKFSFATPNEISRAYLRITDPITGNAPSSKRIIQDCLKWLDNLEVILKAGGKMVEGFGRNGHREHIPRYGTVFKYCSRQGLGQHLNHPSVGTKLCWGVLW
jgi:hypothetical protein